MNKKYDIVVFGATGFTGELTAHYLAKKMQSKQFTMAIAGRDADKLNRLKQSMVSIHPSCNEIGIILADVNDYQSLLKMALDSRILITTVGPYLKYGEQVVKACIEGKADYLDLTGEGKFVENIHKLFYQKAVERKVRIINCCGYDSVPADLGTYFTVQKFTTDEPIEIECFISFSSDNAFNSISGGTWHSAIGFMNYGELNRAKKSYQEIAQMATNSRKIGIIPPQLRYRQETKKYGVPVPFVDNEVVLKSAALMPEYGSNFSYGHYLAVDSIVDLLGLLVGSGIVLSLAQLDITKKFLLDLKKPGEGPDESQRKRNQFITSFIGRSKSKVIKTEVSGGDPGYGETSKILAESALCLLLDTLPERYGVITPAYSMGNQLINRLHKAGIQFRLVS